MSEDIADQIRRRLQARMGELGLTARAVSERAALNAGALSDILSGRSRNPGLISLAQIAAALDLDLSALLGKGASREYPTDSIGGGQIRPSHVLLIICGGIAAYKALDLIRRLREQGIEVRALMTEAAQQFITPLSVGALTGGKVFTELFDREAKHDVGHIRLAREADCIVIAPVSADFLAKMAHGLADDLASAVLLANDRPLLVAPAMNPKMWAHPATKRNVAVLKEDGVRFIGPDSGEMAERNETGIGRMAEPSAISAMVKAILNPSLPLAGRHAIVTSGPTHEPIDPVRFIANRSSGKQGHAIAEALVRAGARVTLVSGPVALADPAGAKVVHVERAEEMLAAVEAALPADIAILAAAVADWRLAEPAEGKIKKDRSVSPPLLRLAENPDILSHLAHRNKGRPRLVIGFAAETENLLANARAKLAAKGCDWILANDVSEKSGVLGGDENEIHLLSKHGVEGWPRLSKRMVAEKLSEKIAAELAAEKESKR